MINPSGRTKRLPPALSSQSLEAAARSAFAEHVRLYDDGDQIIVDVELRQLRFVYVNFRASRQSGSDTFIECHVAKSCEQMWISRLQVSDPLRRQGLGREMVEAAEATARAIGVPVIKVYPLIGAAGFWEQLGYTPDQRFARVQQKDCWTRRPSGSDPKRSSANGRLDARARASTTIA